MPKIPIYQATPQVSESVNPRADAGMLSAQFQGAQQLGAGLRDVAQTVGQIGQKVAAAEEFRAELELNTRLDSAKKEYASQLKTSTDTADWVQGFERTVDDVVGGMDLKRLTPAARDRLTAQVQSFRKVGATDFSTLARATEVKWATDMMTAGIEDAAKNGDLDTANRLLDNGVTLGLVHPEIAAQQRKKIPERVEEHQAMLQINTSPVQAKKDIKAGKYPNLSEQSKYALMNRAQEETQKLQTETYRGIIDDTVGQKYWTLPELQKKVDEGLITATQMESYNQTYIKGRRKKLDTQESAALAVEVMEYDPNLDPTKEKFISLQSRIATEGLLESTMQTLGQELSSRFRSQDAIEATSTRELQRYVDALFTSGQLGQYRTADLDEAGKPVVNPEVFKRATLKKAELLSAGLNFLRKNPKATPKEVLDVVAPGATTSSAVQHSKAIFSRPSK